MKRQPKRAAKPRSVLVSAADLERIAEVAARASALARELREALERLRDPDATSSLHWPMTDLHVVGRERRRGGAR